MAVPEAKYRKRLLVDLAQSLGLMVYIIRVPPEISDLIHCVHSRIDRLDDIPRAIDDIAQKNSAGLILSVCHDFRDHRRICPVIDITMDTSWILKVKINIFHMFTIKNHFHPPYPDPLCAQTYLFIRLSVHIIGAGGTCRRISALNTSRICNLCMDWHFCTAALFENMSYMNKNARHRRTCSTPYHCASRVRNGAPSPQPIRLH